MRPAKRILVVDDEKTILLSLSYALKADGVEVITCNKEEWAEKALLNYYFDLIITDLRLAKTEDQGGLQIVEVARRKHPNAKIIVMTAFGTDEVRQEVKRLGADAFFDKPVDLEDLIRTIERLGIPMKRKAATPKSTNPGA